MTLRRLTAAPPLEESDLALDPRCTTQILTGFIANELRRTGRNRLVVGLSGGLDSAVAAELAVRAIGAEQVTALLMPFRTSHPNSLGDATRYARRVGLPTETIDITPMVDAFAAASGPTDAHRLGNVMARVRMILLYDRSQAWEALVLGTSNKTELLLGYGTLHGDLASAINPLGDLYKTQVRALARYLDVPASIRNKPPSADLWPEQTDENDLGFSYETVDRLLALLVEARVGRATAIARGFGRELVDQVTRRIVRSQFKRRPPLIAKVSSRSVGWDFRYPRDWLS